MGHVTRLLRRSSAWTSRRRSYYVYAIEIAPRELYVGQSALTPAERLRRHLAHRKASHAVTRSVLAGQTPRLRQDLYRGQNPLTTREAAQAAEQRLRARLEARGYTVRGACAIGRDPRCDR